MRQNAPQKRGRGRPSGRRPFGNPLNRTYDSSGPDVKVRGTATHIYDKYQALARDATSSGDRIAAENYLQHAEHYYRLMMAAQAAAAANQARQPQSQGGGNVQAERNVGDGTGEQPDAGDYAGQEGGGRYGGDARRGGGYADDADDDDQTNAPTG